jgi:1-hydroxycarotenoid 3,4-desaturase
VRTKRVVIIGAGIGGLAAAVELSAHGLDVTILERAQTPGGKMREVEAGGLRIDAGPTVFTMRWVFEDILATAGTSLDAELELEQAEIIARHAWSADQRLDLFADLHRSADAVAAFAGPDEGRRFLAFSDDARAIYRTLKGPFISGSRTNPIGLTRRVGPAGIGGLFNIKPFSTMWKALAGHFRDPRLRQLFGRYATYAGSSPYLAPATLMLIAHVEQEGVWLVKGGMHQLAVALAHVAERNGATIRYGAEVAEILTERGRACGVRLAGGDGQRIDADAVVLNADVSAPGNGLLGTQVVRAVPPTAPTDRSLSALTWNLAAKTSGFPLLRHSVFFSSDYPAEFDDIFQHRRLPREPTVYICAQDRGARCGSDAAGSATQPDGPERLLLLVNAPAVGDTYQFHQDEIKQCEARTLSLLQRCGLHLECRPEAMRITTPNEFERLFPATGGALYGRASHGWQASFSRPGSRSKVPGLYLAGGSTHPGAGVPMAALSGRQAAASLVADLASTRA